MGSIDCRVPPGAVGSRALMKTLPNSPPGEPANSSLTGRRSGRKVNKPMASYVHRVPLVFLLASLGCDANQGALPPPNTLNFPSALAISPERDGNQFLLVASANFDVRYNAGALHSFDLNQLRTAIDECADPPCAFQDVGPFIVSEAFVSSHTSGLAFSPRGDRAYLAVRATADMTWVDFDPATGSLNCDGEGQPELCAARRETTLAATDCGRTPVLLGDPIAIVAESVSRVTGLATDDDYVVMMHRNGNASLFVDRVVDGLRQPVLVHTTDGLPPDLVQASYEPASGLIWTHSAFANSNRATRSIGFAGVSYDETNPECSSVFAAGSLLLRGLDDGFDTRDSAFSPDGSRAYVVSRRPEALVRIDMDRSPLFPGEAAIDQTSIVGYGPSRVERVTVDSRDILAVSCFDDRKVWFIDGASGRTLGVVPRLAGPYEMVDDPANELLWVADFRDSILSAIDYSPLHTGGEPRLVATFGRVRPVGVLR